MRNSLHRRIQPLFFGGLTLALAALGGCRKSEPQGGGPQGGEQRMSGTIKGVDEKARTLVVRDTLPVKNPNEVTKVYRTFRVAMDCKIEKPEGGEALFSDLKVGKHVKVRYTPDQQEFTAREIELKADRPGTAPTVPD